MFRLHFEGSNTLQNPWVIREERVPVFLQNILRAREWARFVAMVGQIALPSTREKRLAKFLGVVYPPCAAWYEGLGYARWWVWGLGLVERACSLVEYTFFGRGDKPRTLLVTRNSRDSPSVNLYYRIAESRRSWMIPPIQHSQTDLPGHTQR